MSHYIIINGVKTRGPHGPLLVEASEEEAVSYEIKYTPSHDMTENQVGDAVTKILKLASKIENVAAGETAE